MGKLSDTDRGLGRALEPPLNIEGPSRRLYAQNKIVQRGDSQPAENPVDLTYLQGLHGETVLPAHTLDPTAVALLRRFFELLDQWDRPPNGDGPC